MDPESGFEWGEVRFSITNASGGAAFFLEDCRLELGIRKQAPAPEEENFRRFYLNDFGEVLAQGGSWNGTHSMIDVIPPDVAEQVYARDLKIFFFGLIRYRDENWNHWELGFCAEWMLFADERRGELWAFAQFNSEPYRFDRPAKDLD